MGADSEPAVEAVIELDRHWAPPTPDRRHRWRPYVPMVVLAMVALFGLVAFVGSTPPPPSLGDPLWTAPGGPFVVVGDTVVVLGSNGTTAYDARTGAVRWYRPGIALSVAALGPDVVGEVAGKMGDLVLRLDARTGATLGPLAGQVLFSGRFGSVVPLRSSACAADQRCGDVIGQDPVTGDVRWRVALPASALVLGAAGASAFVTLLRGGVVDLWSVQTGAKLREVALPDWPGGDPVDAALVGTVELVGTAVVSLTHTTRADGTIVGQVRATDLMSGHQWSTQLPLTYAISADDQPRLTSCDRWLCLFDGDGTVLLDPATGAVTRRFVGVVIGTFGADLLVRPIGRPDEPYRVLVVYRPETGTATPYAAGVEQIVDRPGRPSLLVTTLVGTTRSDVALANGAPLGTIDAVDRCAASADILVCVHDAPSTNALLSAWLVPDAAR